MKGRTYITVGLLLTIGAGTLLAAERDICVNNMAQLDAFTQQYAYANKIDNGQQIPVAELHEAFSQYMKRELKKVQCPAGGEYTFGIVGASPTCSVHGSLVDIRSATKRERETHARPLRISDARADAIHDGAKTGPIEEWSSLNLTLASLQTWGTKEYSFSSRSPGRETIETHGTVTLTTEVTPDTVILQDSYQMTDRGQKMSLKMIHACRRDNFLSPNRIESIGEGNDEFTSFVATVADGTMTVSSKGLLNSVSEFPGGVITMSAMMRLVTLASRTPGTTISFEYWLESGELNLKKNYRLFTLQPETITCGGRQVKCSKFRLTGGGINPVYYWVTEDGVLQRILIDDRKVLELASTTQPPKIDKAAGKQVDINPAVILGAGAQREAAAGLGFYQQFVTLCNDGKFPEAKAVVRGYVDERFFDKNILPLKIIANSELQGVLKDALPLAAEHAASKRAKENALLAWGELQRCAKELTLSLQLATLNTKRATDPVSGVVVFVASGKEIVFIGSLDKIGAKLARDLKSGSKDEAKALLWTLETCKTPVEPKPQGDGKPAP
ncbi:MAG: hypothetical protein WC299_09155 [Kiritimatiellia bacterium]